MPAVPATSVELTESLDLSDLAAWLQEQRWYGTKSQTIAALEVQDAVTLAPDPAVVLALVGARLADGRDERYQLVLRFADDDADAGDGAAVIQRTTTATVLDALADPARARVLLTAIDAETALDGERGRVSFHRGEYTGPLDTTGPARPMGVEQSNSSIVFSDTVLKVFRRLEPGVNPELEVLRFLTRRGYPNIAPLRGWCDYQGPGIRATLAVAQGFVATARGGWEMALERIGSDPDGLLTELADLGRATAELHNALASDPDDPGFAPAQPDADALAVAIAEIDADVQRVFARLPEDHRLAAIAGRGEELRGLLATASRSATGGRAIRTHGDYHLGQTLHTAEGWVIIDFEGEPARPLAERRAKRSPLRDVASMLRSFAYVTAATEMTGAAAAPNFEARARDAYLNAYLGVVHPILLPDGDVAVTALLSLFELEKVVYELRYELDNRPDWLPIPAAGIRRLLEPA
jgi:maltokinase